MSSLIHGDEIRVAFVLTNTPLGCQPNWSELARQWCRVHNAPNTGQRSVVALALQLSWFRWRRDVRIQRYERMHQRMTPETAAEEQT